MLYDVVLVLLPMETFDHYLVDIELIHTCSTYSTEHIMQQRYSLTCVAPIQLGLNTVSESFMCKILHYCFILFAASSAHRVFDILIANLALLNEDYVIECSLYKDSMGY